MLSLANATDWGGSAWRGLSLVIFYCAGLGIPFLLLAFGFSWAAGAMGFLRRNTRTIQIVGAVCLIVLGLLMLTGVWGSSSPGCRAGSPESRRCCDRPRHQPDRPRAPRRRRRRRPDADRPPSRPGQGGLGRLIAFGRNTWRQLTSMRTALILLFLLALASLPGALLPQWSLNSAKTAQYIIDHPTLGPLLDRFGFFEVFGSPWYAAIYLLLFTSLVGCLLPRTLEFVGQLRMDAGGHPAQPRPAAAPPRERGRRDPGRWSPTGSPPG